MYVIGTAGHVDHGKSVLVEALTGIDPDRLREEKERGMTIDLGFAWMSLPSGREVSIVDVPGHERFVKNMLAGVGGIDLALLIVAADEGVMPQTREHLAILDLLQIRSGVLVITKKDLVEADFLELVSADVLDLAEGTTLEGSPRVACSAVSGEGLDELVSVIDRRLEETTARRDIGRPRLPIDRAFTIAGFGTVVTGTLIDGSLAVGQEVEIVPGGRRTRIRGLQTHRQQVEKALPGTRTAANLTGVAKDDLYRGQVVTPPGWLVPTRTVDVRLHALASLPRPIRHNARLTFHSGASEVNASVRLLDRDSLPPGEEGWAQLRLDRPVALVKGDYFVVRDPNETVGGGQVLDTRPRRHRRFQAATVAALTALDRGSPEEVLVAALGNKEPTEVATLARETNLSVDEARAGVERLIEEGRVVALTPLSLDVQAPLFTAQGFTALGERVQEAVAAFCREYPLRRGIRREELRSRLRLPARVFSLAIEHWLREGKLREWGALVAPSGHRPTPTAAQEAEASAYLQRLEASPYSPPTDRAPGPELLAYLEDSGQVVNVGDGVVFTASAYREMVERIVGHIREHGTITLAQVRDLFGTSRKYAQALLEHLDRRRVTRRVVGERVLREPPPP